ncbi:ATP-binding protein [Actinoplanes sp. NPDC049599]|uniref:ATP-binding protein n=1 Tax=Actinoplanes sp. NPDC049599 TaxID=3363903 RepID=UPI0037B9C924
MEVDPPYLLAGGEDGHPGVSLSRDAVTGVIEVTVSGRWNRRLCLDVYTVLRKCMAEIPSAIIIELHNLRDLDGESASMWLAVARAASTLQPPAQLALSLPPTRRLAGRLRRLGAVRQLPIFVTVQQARVAMAGRVPLTEHLHLSLLPPEPASVGTAGNLVAVACDAWGLPVVTEPSRVIIRELVSNAVRHAGTDIAVTVSRRGSGIYLAVNDGDPRLPSLSEPLVRPPPGYRRNERRGLWAVHSRASAWGAMPSPNGKVVWALVRPRARLTAGGPAA